METDPHTQPLPLSPILDFSTDNLSGGLVAKDRSSSQATWHPLAGSLHPSKPAVGWGWGGRGGSVWGEGASEGPRELKGGGAARSEMHSVPTALIRMEPFFLSLRHLRDGDLIEKKKGLYVGNPQSVKEFGTGKGAGSRLSEPAFSWRCLTFTLQNWAGGGGGA